MRWQFFSILAGLLLVGVSLTNLAEWARQAPGELDEAVYIEEEIADIPTASPTPTASQNAWMSGTGQAVLPDEPETEAIGAIPEHISIPAIQLEADIVPVGKAEREVQGETYEQWKTPKNDVGWHNTSALIGVTGNSVFNGHHNIYARVFKDLVNLRAGDLIKIQAGGQTYIYKVELTLLLAERFRPIEERMENARWLLTTDDERITLVTCWPPFGNTHRVVIVAFPLK